MRHAADHHRQQLRFGHFFDIWPHCQRCLGLPNKHAGTHRRGFGAGNAHDFGDANRHPAHDQLHHAEVVQHTHQGSEENYRRQYLEGENKARLRNVDQARKDKARARRNKFQGLDEAFRQYVKNIAHKWQGKYRSNAESVTRDAPKHRIAGIVARDCKHDASQDRCLGKHFHQRRQCI